MNRTLFDLSDPPPPPEIWSVAELNERLRDLLQREFASVWVRGEITDLARPSSGHIYLTLKDEQGSMRGVMWRSTASRLRFDLKDGLQVVCEGQIDVYPPRGTYQLIIRQLEPQGIGGLQLAFLQLRDRLDAEGLFDPRRKRPLPKMPRRIGVVTSPTGAAIRDFSEVQRRRWPAAQILLIPTRVQGDEAVPEIVQAIQLAEKVKPALDCLVVTRGGGSLEDLWCFNDERVVRAIASCSLPVVSAIGHEIDVTLSDLAADVRALTPSEAAERVVPSCEEIQSELQAWQRRLDQVLLRRLQLARVRLDALAQRPVFVRPEQRWQDAARRLDEWEARLHGVAQQRWQSWNQSVCAMAARLEALSPLAVLSRGYSLTQRYPEGQCLKSADQIQPGELVMTQLAQGRLLSRVTQVTTEEEPEIDALRTHTTPS